MNMKPGMAILMAVLGLLPAIGTAAVLQGNPSNYLTQLGSLQPGDTLELESGVYSSGLNSSGINGTANAWITIRGPADRSAVILGRSCCNTIELGGSSYVEISQLTLDGQGLGGPFGVNTNQQVITLRSLG